MGDIYSPARYSIVMNIQEYVELNTFSTFMVQSQARYFTTVASVVDIQELITTEVWKNNKRYILGEGSNTLFVNDIEHLVVKNAIEGLEVVSEDDNSMALRVGAGENWHTRQGSHSGISTSSMTERPHINCRDVACNVFTARLLQIVVL